MVVKKLVVEGRIPDLNDYVKACRTNKYVGAKMKREIEAVISAYIRQQFKGVAFDGTVTLNFKWYEPNRKRDIDNIASAKKFLLDALVSCGIIETDGWRGVYGFTDTFFLDKDRPRVEVEIIGELKNG
jgi:Holliday junction resolvase RusA-like endonuclease